MQIDNQPDTTPQRSIRWVFFGNEGLRAGWSILLFLLFAGLLATLLTAAFKHFAPPQIHKGQGLAPSYPLIIDGCMFGVAAISAFLVSRIEKRNPALYGIGPLSMHRVQQFAMGIVFGVTTLSLLMLALKLSGTFVIDGVLLHGMEIVQWGAAWACAFVVVALAEEFLMRGFLQYTLARGVAGIAKAMGHEGPVCQRIGFWVAAGFFSLLFGLMHGSNPGESPIGLISAGLIGLVFAYSLWRTGSLWWAIGFHAAWDWSESFLWGVPDSGGISQHRLLATHPQGSPLMSGGLTGPEGSLMVLPVALLVAAIIALTLKHEPGSPAEAASHPPL